MMVNTADRTLSLTRHVNTLYEATASFFPHMFCVYTVCGAITANVEQRLNSNYPRF